MKGTIQKLILNERECLVYLPNGYETSGLYYPVIYLNGVDRIPEIMDIIEPHMGEGCQPFILIGIQSVNWNDDFSPWPVAGLTEGNGAFGGGARDYLKFLVDTVKPYMDDHYHAKKEPENTALVGYSLGGLAALYSLYTENSFGRVGSISGSLWFDKWIEFMNSSMPVNIETKVYLSLGKGEERNRNQNLAKVGACTRKASEILARQLKDRENIILEWNDGGHFSEIDQRYKKAILWLMGDN
ncbi:MAG: alpha/beta hydrolase-fold protein [Bacillota bacterium]|nr:alpha/beta hydrolase-fold protein [Bacillota bacterium]